MMYYRNTDIPIAEIHKFKLQKYKLKKCRIHISRLQKYKVNKVHT